VKLQLLTVECGNRLIAVSVNHPCCYLVAVCAFQNLLKAKITRNQIYNSLKAVFGIPVKLMSNICCTYPILYRLGS